MASIEIRITPSSEKTAKLTAPLLTPNRCFINLICTLTGGKEKYLSSKLAFSFTNISEQYNNMGLTQESNNLNWGAVFMYSEKRDLLILKTALLAFLHERLTAAEKLPDGLNSIPKYLDIYLLR